MTLIQYDICRLVKPLHETDDVATIICDDVHNLVHHCLQHRRHGGHGGAPRNRTEQPVTPSRGVRVAPARRPTLRVVPKSEASRVLGAFSDPHPSQHERASRGVLSMEFTAHDAFLHAALRTCSMVCSAFVGNLPPSMTEGELQALFCRYGAVLGVRIPLGKRFGFVDAADQNALMNMIHALNGLEVHGHALRVDPAAAKQGDGGGGGGGGGAGRRPRKPSGGVTDFFTLEANADPRGETSMRSPKTAKPHLAAALFANQVPACASCVQR